ncbi:unnamed protein product [Merluccius merluccius]
MVATRNRVVGVVFILALHSHASAVTCKEPTGRTKSKHTEVSGVKSSYSPGDVLDFRCLPPYVLKGSSSSTCGDNGQWIDLPKCKRKSCGSAGEIENGEFIYNGAEFGDTATAVCAQGQVIQYRCREGTLVGEGKIWCTENGTWSSPPPTCGGKSCGSAGEIENGEFIYNGAEFGDTATAVCAQG